MKRLTLWTVALCTLFAAMSTASVVVGRQNRAYVNEAEELGLRWCNGMPCFMGIQPGVTTWADAENTVGSLHNAELTASEGQFLTIIFHGVTVTIFRNQQHAKVS